MKVRRPLLVFLGAIQLALAIRVLARLARSANGSRIPAEHGPSDASDVAVIVPVLNEVDRLQGCLECLFKQNTRVSEILVVDGGSTDGTRELVRSLAVRDERLRLIEAGSAPSTWNGKAWNLETGTSAVSSAIQWILCIDADVRVAPELASSVTAFAERNGLEALSVATSQELGDVGSGVVHPSMLTTLVYRFGIPGHDYYAADRVQANGQCFLLSIRALSDVGGFASVSSANAEDIALARMLVRLNYGVGFFESDDLATVRMYDDWRGTWSGWGRSLPVRDHASRLGWVSGLAEVVAVQGLPLPATAFVSLYHSPYIPKTFSMINLGLAVARLGVLVGTRRAYVDPPWTYWLSPLADIPVACNLIVNSLRKTHSWRGRRLMIEE